jgi:hypothetical protein
MSLKAFHFFFIVMSVALATFMAAWALGQYRLESQVGYALTSVASIGAGAVLVVYAARFRRKARQL